MKYLTSTTALLCMFSIQCIEKNNQKFSRFPKDLMYKSKPIHPSCLMQTQFGDSSHYEPIKISSWNSYNISDGYIEIKDRNTIFDKKTNTVKSDITYIFSHKKEKDEHPKDEHLFEEYQYIGSYKNKHIIHSFYQDTAGSGNLTFLTAIKRKENMMINAGEIAAGNITNINLDNHRLHYSQQAYPNTIAQIISNESFESNYSHGFPGVDLIYEVDLTARLQKYQDFSSNMIGIKFYMDEINLEETSINSEKLFDQYFYQEAFKRLETGKKKLNKKEMENFICAVLKSVKKEKLLKKLHKQNHEK